MSLKLGSVDVTVKRGAASAAALYLGALSQGGGGGVAATAALLASLRAKTASSPYIIGAVDRRWSNTTVANSWDIVSAISNRTPGLRIMEYVDPNRPAGGTMANSGAVDSPLQIAAIRAHIESGGVVSLHCHSGNPVTGSLEIFLGTLASGSGSNGDTAGNPVLNCLPGGSRRTQWLAFVDRLSGVLASIAYPVILRMFHEMTSGAGWFWWNTTAERASLVLLQRDMVTRLKANGRTNVLYDFNMSYGYTNPELWYPGAAYVDLITGDYYDESGTPTSLQGSAVATGATQQRAIDATKVLAFAEIGNTNGGSVTDIWNVKTGDVMETTYQDFAFVALWSNPQGPNIGDASAPGFVSMMTDVNCLTLDKLTDPYAGTVPDTIAPVLSAPTAVQTTTTAALAVITTKPTGTLYWYVSTSATPPSLANLRSGSGAVVFGNKPVYHINPTLNQTATATGLTDGTTYYAYFNHVDRAGNSSAIAASAAFSTVVGSVFLQDLFNGTVGAGLLAHTPDIGGTWSVHPSYAPPVAAVLSGNGTLYYPPATAVTGAWINSAVPVSADYFVEGTVFRLANSDFTPMGVCGRVDATADTMYMARWNDSSNVWQLYKIVGGTPTQLGSDYADASNFSSKVVRLTMSGSTISMSVAGVVRVAVTDSVSPIAAKGLAGIRIGIGAVGANATNATQGVHLGDILASA